MYGVEVPGAEGKAGMAAILQEEQGEQEGEQEGGQVEQGRVSSC